MSKLTNIGYIKELMEKYGLSFQKQFGQNFLTNETIPRRIASYISGNALEIGPGAGCLTYELSQVCDRVVAIEVDSGLIPLLGESLADCGNVTVINTDALKLDLQRLKAEQFGEGELSVAANLPYNITTPIIMKLLQSGVKFKQIVVMVQKEVAQRFSSKPGDELYGAVTAEIAYYARVERLFSVDAGNFLPRPKVDSEVIRFIPHEKPPVDVYSEEMLLRVIKGAFAQRRKTLYNSLGATLGEFSKSEIGLAIEKAGLSPSARGETLSLADFECIANVLCESNKQKG